MMTMTALEISSVETAGGDMIIIVQPILIRSGIQLLTVVMILPTLLAAAQNSNVQMANV